MVIILSLLLFTSLTVQRTVAKSETPCAQHCSGKANFVNLSAENVYIYAFTIKHYVNPSLSDKQIEKTQSGLVHLTTISPCLADIKLMDVREHSQVSYEGEGVHHASPFNYTSDKAVQFCYDNGRIQKVWMNDEDSTQLSNLKRAILSHLQLSIDSLELPTYTIENDISGRCLTEFHPVKEETTSVTIMKTKYTTGCTDKYVFQSPLTNYEIDAPTQSSKLPHVTGIMQCEIQLRPTQEILQTSCNETLNITSSSLMQNSQSVVVRTITEIRLVRKTQSEERKLHKTEGIHETTMFFTHPTVANNNYDRLKFDELVELFVELDNLDVTGQAKRFYHLTEIIRAMRLEELEKMHLKISRLDSNHTKRRFQDAVLNAGTSNAIRFLFSTKMNEQLSAVDKEKALKALRHPTMEIVPILRDYLNEEFTPVRITLVTILLRKICQKETNCMRDLDLRHLITRLFDAVPPNCSSEELQKVITVKTVLHAIGNIGKYVEPEFLSRLLAKCLDNELVDVNLKVAAAKAVREADNIQQIEEILWNCLNDQREDTEVRIVAYQIYMRCPSTEKFDNVTRLLETELSQQVGSYIHSHLVSLLSTENHMKQSWRALLTPYETKIMLAGKKFTLNSRSYSKHYEHVLVFEQQTILMEASIVFGPESFIPRSVTLNLTLITYGRVMNLFELCLRSTNQQALVKLWRRVLWKTDDELAPQVKHTDQFDSGTRQYPFRTNKLPTTSLYLRQSGEERIYIPYLTRGTLINYVKDAFGLLEPWPNETGHTSFLWDLSLLFPTIGGSVISQQINCVLYGRFKHHFAMGQSYELNLNSEHALRIVQDLQLNGQAQVLGTRHEISVAVSANTDASAKFKITNDWDVQLLLKPWVKPVQLFKLEKRNSVYIDRHELELSGPSEQGMQRFRFPPEITRVFGLVGELRKISPKYGREASQLDGCELVIDEFYGIEWRLNVDSGLSLLGGIRRINLLFKRPGCPVDDRNNGRYAEFSIQSDWLNQTTPYVDLIAKAPWGHELEVRAKFSEKGIVQATVNINEHHCDLYGVYEQTQQQTKLTAHVSHPRGRLLLVFRGNFTGSYQLVVREIEQMNAFQLTMTKRSIRSRHTQYPTFHRTHHETRLSLGHDQTVQLQLEWNVGDKNGLLREGIVKLNSQTSMGAIKIRGDFYWTEGDQLSTLDNAVEGYGRQLHLKSQLTNPGQEMTELSMDLSQFMSKEFWILHTNKPAIFSLYGWTYSPQSDRLNSNASLIWWLAYRLDQGGELKARATLSIPTQNIDSVANGELHWKGHTNHKLPWITQIQAILTLRLFPENIGRYIHLTCSHVIEHDALTAISLELQPYIVYVLESHLIRGQSVHIMRLKWPENQSLNMNTSYKLQIGKNIQLGFDSAVTLNDIPYLDFKSEFEYEQTRGRFELSHVSRRRLKEDSELLAHFQLGTELHSSLTFSPFTVTYVGSGHILVLIPQLYVDTGLELSTSLGLINGQVHVKFVALQKHQGTQEKYGIEFVTFFENTLTRMSVASTLLLHLDPKTHRISDHKPTGWNFRYNSSKRSRIFTVELIHTNLGSLTFTEKNRLLPHSGYNMDGSIMFALNPSTSFGRFTGWYANYNYDVEFSAKRYAAGLNGEFTPRSGIGPGTPLRLHFSFTPENNFESGTIESVINSQHLGYWTGYEMVTLMSNYMLENQQAKRSNKTLSLRSILGYRLFEGRGTRAFEGSAFLLISPTGNMLEGWLKFGRPGTIAGNQVFGGYAFLKNRIDVWVFVYLNEREELNSRLVLVQEDSWMKVNGSARINIPRLELTAELRETVTNRNQTTLEENTNIDIKLPNAVRYYANKSLWVKPNDACGISLPQLRLEWESNVRWLRKGAVEYQRTKTASSRYSDVTVDWDNYTSLNLSHFGTLTSNHYFAHAKMGAKDITARCKTQNVQNKSSLVLMEVNVPFKMISFRLQTNASHTINKQSNSHLVQIDAPHLLLHNLVIQHDFQRIINNKNLVNLRATELIAFGGKTFFDHKFVFVPDQQFEFVLHCMPLNAHVTNVSIVLQGNKAPEAEIPGSFVVRSIVELNPLLPRIEGTLKAIPLLTSHPVPNNFENISPLSLVGIERTHPLQGVFKYVADNAGMPNLIEADQQIQVDLGNYNSTVLCRIGLHSFKVIGELSVDVSSIVDSEPTTYRLLLDSQIDETRYESVFHIQDNHGKYGFQFNLSSVYSEEKLHVVMQSALTHKELALNGTKLTAELLIAPEWFLVLLQDEESQATNKVWLKLETNLLHSDRVVCANIPTRIVLQVFETLLNVSMFASDGIGLVEFRNSDENELRGIVSLKDDKLRTVDEDSLLKELAISVHSTFVEIPPLHLLLGIERKFQMQTDTLNLFRVLMETGYDVTHSHFRLMMEKSTSDAVLMTLNNSYFLPMVIQLHLSDSLYECQVSKPEQGTGLFSESLNTSIRCASRENASYDCAAALVYGPKSVHIYTAAEPRFQSYQLISTFTETWRFGTTLTARRAFFEWSLLTPLRDIVITRKVLNSQDTNQTTLWNIRSIPQESSLGNGHRFMNASMQLLYAEERSAPHTDSWLYGIELNSELLKKGTIGLFFNCSQTADNFTVWLKSTSDNGNINWDHLLLELFRLTENTFRSKLHLNVGNKKMLITGKSLMEAQRLQSAINVTTQNTRNWNVSIDSWKLVEFTDGKGTHILHQFELNSHGMLMHDRLYLHDGLVTINQTTRLSISPADLMVQAFSRKGVVWLVGKSQGTEHLLEMRHNSSTVFNQRDAVFRIYVDPDNMLYIRLHWRPIFFKEALTNGTELMHRPTVERLLEAAVQPTIGFITEAFDDVYEYFLSKAIDWHLIEAIRTTLVEDLQTAPNTLKEWLAKDTFYLHTLNLPLISRLSLLNVTEFEYNITEALGEVFHACKHARSVMASPTRWLVDRIVPLMEDLAGRQYESLKRTLTALLRETNHTLQKANELRHYLFFLVSTPLEAFGSTRWTIFKWAEEFCNQLYMNSLSPILGILQEFSGFLFENLRVLASVGEYFDYWLRNIRRGAIFTLQELNKLVFGSEPRMTWSRLIYLLINNHTEEAYQTLFHPERHEFKTNFDRGSIQFTTYIPTLLKDLFGPKTTLRSTANQVLLMFVPKEGMKSLMYLYDQYQRSFDVPAKVMSWIPPYEVIGWMIIGPYPIAHLVTFNGLYVPIPRILPATYLLAKDWVTNAMKIVQSVGPNTWETRVYFGEISLSVGQDGKVMLLTEETSRPQVLPSSISLANFTLVVRRVADRITVVGRHLHLSDTLFVIQFDIGLQQIQFTLGGYWHGRTFGLLGAHTFDQIDELKGLHGQTAQPTNVTAYRWRYQHPSADEMFPNEFRAIQELLDKQLDNSTEITNKLCLQYLNKLSSCYDRVPVYPWYKACRTFVHHQSLQSNLVGETEGTPQDKMSTSEQSRHEHVCRIVRSFAQLCNQKQVAVRVPAECVICDSSLKADGLSRVTFSETPARRGHVLFVLQMHQCLVERRNEIANLIWALERDPTKDMEYSAVLFDGPADIGDITWLTSASGILTNMTGSSFLRTLDSVLESFHENESKWTVLNKPVLDAVLNALHGPSSAGAAHMALLLYLCEECTASKSSMYGPVQRMLERKGIEFHYLPHTSFQTASGSSGTVFLLQGDETVHELIGSVVSKRSNLGSIMPPRDQCTIIAQKLNGYIWAYRDVTGPLSRRTIAMAMAKILKRPIAIHKKCYCRDNRYGQGILDCITNKTVPAETIFSD
ncbi:hypothetical protein CSKR_203002 [Clonorchis sinensis]|uniref:Vitellogenin domain-containing protein n=1 Tax=Clonorchis sinensis TaxID=79923 RepID=A0A8T1M6E4_CLOSI|nr:hypothetical protein CSKR_203002 [Clonorchis sinensis]